MKKKYTIEEFKEYFEKSSLSLILGLQNIVAI